MQTIHLVHLADNKTSIGYVHYAIKLLTNVNYKANTICILCHVSVTDIKRHIIAECTGFHQTRQAFIFSLQHYIGDTVSGHLCLCNSEHFVRCLVDPGILAQLGTDVDKTRCYIYVTCKYISNVLKTFETLV